jgi:predicted amidohydrolase YtcJ
VNSRALALAGLTRDTQDPPDGRYVRSPDGELTGHLIEGAAYRFESSFVPAPAPAERAEAIMAAQAELHSFGITGWQDAWVTPPTLDAYRSLASAGLLIGRVRAALWWERDQGLGQISSFVEARSAVTGPELSASTVKIMVDGVMENHSASLLSPYQLSCSAEHSGSLYVSSAVLRDAVIELDRLDFQVHLHTIGDRAVRVALDAIEAARAANGERGNRHHLAHLQLIDPADVPRFGSLGAAANCQAYWAQSEPAMDQLTIPFIGAERAAWQYPFASLAAGGAVLAMGSDWPVSTANPLAQIEVAVRRTDPSRRSAPPFLPAERLSLDTALRAFTAGSAYVNHDPDGGVLAPGLRADLCVLDRNPFLDLAAGDRFSTTIADARVLYTIASGRIVYSA